MNKTACFFLLYCLTISLTSFAAGKNPVIAQKPSWVLETPINYAANKFDKEAQDGYTDLYFDKQVSLQQQSIYYKKVAHILSEAGVQNKSQISIDYDPSYQSLQLHSIDIIRGGQRINKLILSKIKTIQQEKELDRFLYNGSLTAVLFLEDVRKDDIIEYSYTVKGFNPIFGNKFSATFQTKFGVPVYGFRYRIEVPPGRTIRIKNKLTDLQPLVSTSPIGKVYEWKADDVPAVHTEPALPSWVDAYPTIMISEVEGWKEVADWAAALFPFPTSLSGGLQKKVAEIKAAHPTAEAQLLATLRFVQDDIRYMGIEIGVNSHKPHAPAQILQQRFGDCKDKAYLLCTLLKALGIEAYPVLTNTYAKKSLAQWLPAPTDFDHATVCAVVNGKTFWFDPTISFQRGALQSISYPDYEMGLVLKQGATDLSSIPLQDNGEIKTKEIFSVKSLHRSVQLKVLTSFSGSFADNARSSFKNNGLTDMKKSYKSLYDNYFKKLEADSLITADNEETGVFTTTEFYTIHNFWKSENAKESVSLFPFLVNSVLKTPEESRKAAFALSYPARYHETIEIELPKPWKVEEYAASFNDASFNLDCKYSQLADNVVSLQYNYETLSDHIDPAQLAHAAEQLNTADKSLAFELYTNERNDSAASLDLPANNGFTAAYVALGLCTLATYFYRKRKRTENRGW